MIEVNVKRDKNNHPVSVEVKGHALFAKQGQDIVCAAVSVLAQTVLFAIEDLLQLKPQFLMREGYLKIFSPTFMKEEGKEKYYLLIETMLLGLKETALAYPRHVSYGEEQL